MLHRFHSTTTQIRATATRIAPTTPRTIAGRDHFTQQRRQAKFTAPAAKPSAHHLRTIPHHF